MAQSFAELATAVCRLFKLGEPERLIKGEPVFLNDVMFSLIHNERFSGERIHLFATFGKVPRDKAVKVLERLLMENHGFNGGGPGFTISPNSGKVVYARNFALGEMTPEELAEKMAYVAEKAKEWQQNYLLDADKDRLSKASRRPHFIQPLPEGER